jgi:hypothetical protein
VKPATERQTCQCCGREFEVRKALADKHREHRNYVWMCGRCLAPTQNVNGRDEGGDQ